MKWRALLTYLKRPIRNITARSNSETTLKQINNENGNRAIISKTENNVAMISIQLDRFSAAS